MEALSEEAKIRRLLEYAKIAPLYLEEQNKLRNGLLILMGFSNLEKMVKFKEIEFYRGRCVHIFCPIDKYDTTPRKAIMMKIADSNRTIVTFHKDICCKEFLPDLKPDEYLTKEKSGSKILNFISINKEIYPFFYNFLNN